MIMPKMYFCYVRVKIVINVAKVWIYSTWLSLLSLFIFILGSQIFVLISRENLTDLCYSYVFFIERFEKIVFRIKIK